MMKQLLYDGEKKLQNSKHCASRIVNNNKPKAPPLNNPRAYRLFVDDVQQTVPENTPPLS